MRVHPRQADWYRRDKGFNLLAQVVISHDSQPSGCSLIIITTNFSQVDFLLGHNNDQGAFNLSGLRKFLEENNIRLLADGGICNFFPNF
jgi:hypothetical protein